MQPCGPASAHKLVRRQAVHKLALPVADGVEPVVACLQVVQCRREDMRARLGRADMAVPLMSRIDAPSLDAAPRLKCVLQYGVGVEGIDIPAVSPLQAPKYTQCALVDMPGVDEDDREGRWQGHGGSASAARTVTRRAVCHAGWLSGLLRRSNCSKAAARHRQQQSGQAMAWLF